MGRQPEAPLRQAVALAYEPGERAPRVVAKGSRELAETLIARAREAGVFVHESPELVALLMQVDLDEEIPEALYLVIAELLAWVWRVEQTQTATLPRAPAPAVPATVSRLVASGASGASGAVGAAQRDGR